MPIDGPPRPMTQRRRAIVALLAGAAWPLGPSLAATSRDAAKDSLRVGEPLGLVDAPLIEGGTFRAAEAEGRLVVVYWWASWCPFCAEMSPSVEKLWRDHRDRGLTVLGISIDKRIDAAREYRRRRGYTFPSTQFSERSQTVLPWPKAVPTLWVRDRAGRVAMVETGQMFAEDVEQIARLL